MVRWAAVRVVAAAHIRPWLLQVEVEVLMVLGVAVVILREGRDCAGNQEREGEAEHCC
jgi:hypothetical protein